MRYCFIPLEYPSSRQGGGVSTYYRVLALQLSKLGHDVTIVTLSSNKSAGEWYDGNVKIIPVTTTKLHYYISKIPLLRKFSLAIREIEYSRVVWKTIENLHQEKSLDVVQSIETGSLFLALFQKKKSYRFVIRLHGEKYTIYKNRPDAKLTLDLLLSRLIQRRAIKKTINLISPTMVHASNIKKEVKIERQIFISPNFHDYEYFDRCIADNKYQMNVDYKKKYVLYAGRLEKGKGLWPLLQSIPSVIKNFPDVHFYLAGNYHPTLSKDDLINYIKVLNIEDNVIILGHVKWEKLFRLYKNSLLVAMPSYYETCGHTYIEAMFLEKPVIAFSGSAMDEMVDNWQSGIVVEKGNIDELSRSIIILLQDEETRKKIGRNARVHAINNFSVNAVMPGLIKFYEESIN